MKLFVTALKIGLSEIRKKLIIIGMAVCLCTAIALFVLPSITRYFEKEDTQFSVVLVNDDKRNEMNMLLSVLVEMEEIKEIFSIEMGDSLDQALEQMDVGKAVGCIYLPEGFLDSVLVGTNEKPQIYLENATTLEARFIGELANILGDVMRYTQSGIYTTLSKLESYDSKVLYEVNFAYVQFLLNRSAMFEVERLTFVPSLTLEIHYGICILVFLLSFTIVLCYKELHIQKGDRTLRHVKSMTQGYSLIYFAKIFWLSIFYACIFAVAGLLLGGKSTVGYWNACFIGSLFFVLVNTLILNICNGYWGSVQLAFLAQVIWLYLAGGIVPTSLLPNLVHRCQWISPIFHIRELLSCGFIRMEHMWIGQMKIAILCGLFLLVMCRILELRTRKGEQNEIC